MKEYLKTVIIIVFVLITMLGPVFFLGNYWGWESKITAPRVILLIMIYTLTLPAVIVWGTSFLDYINEKLGL